MSKFPPKPVNIPAARGQAAEAPVSVQPPLGADQALMSAAQPTLGSVQAVSPVTVGLAHPQTPAGKQDNPPPPSLHESAAVLVKSAEIDHEAEIKRGLLDKREGQFSASWIENPETEIIIREWAQELVALAPPRTERDFAEVLLENLDPLIKRLGGRRGISPA